MSKKSLSSPVASDRRSYTRHFWKRLRGMCFKRRAPSSTPSAHQIIVGSRTCTANSITHYGDLMFSTDLRICVKLTDSLAFQAQWCISLSADTAVASCDDALQRERSLPRCGKKAVSIEASASELYVSWCGKASRKRTAPFTALCSYVT